MKAMTLFLDYSEAAFRGAQKNTSPKYFFLNSKKMYLVKFATISKFFSTCDLPLLAIQMIRYYFSIITDPLNPIGCFFEKIPSQKRSDKK